MCAEELVDETFKTGQVSSGCAVLVDERCEPAALVLTAT